MEYPRMKVRFLRPDDPLAILHGKVYNAILGQSEWICLVDETGDEYAYPPQF